METSYFWFNHAIKTYLGTAEMEKKIVFCK